MSRRQLEDAVEPLIDAISSLVLAAATNSLDSVKESCENISKYTLEVVETAKDEAIASNDIDVQIDLTKAINDIATTIENLVASFNRMFASPNKDTQRAFAKGAKDTGDAIQALLICADMTYLRKITEAVEAADKNANRLKGEARGTKEQLVRAAQANADGIVKVVKLAIKASDATLDKNKGNLLKNVADSIKQLGPALIQQAKAVNMDPHNGANASAMENGYSELRYSFDQLLEYARIMGNYIGKIGEAWEAAQRLLEMARQMEAAALALKKAAYSGSREDFLAAAKRAAAIALELLKAAEAALALEKDPVKRKILASAIEDLRNASKALIAAAQAVHADPNNPQKRQALEDAHTELSRCIERVLALTDPNASPASTFAYVADFLERTAGDVRDDGKKADRPKLVDDAHTLAATALHFVKVTDNLADTMVDQDDRHKLKGIAREVKTAADNLNGQADKVAGNPSNAAEVKELDKQYHNLQNLLDDARRAAGFVVNRPRQGEPEPPPPKPEPPAPGPPVKKAEVDFQKGENELVTAAKQQALEALKIAEDAEKFAHTLDDPKKKQEILEAAGHLRRVAHEVIAAAEDVARNPNDPDKQRILLDKQKDLTAAISKVIGLTMAMQEDIARAMRELEALLAESEALFHEFFAACKACQGDVERDFVAKQGRKTASEMVGSAKNLSTHAANISRLLKEISAKSSDKQFKNQCDSAAKYIRDKSLQCKMISAVKAATTSDEVDDNQVSSAAKGLSAEVGESVKAVRAGLLKRRLQSTQQQTVAIKKIRDLWNQHRNKFL